MRILSIRGSRVPAINDAWYLQTDHPRGEDEIRGRGVDDETGTGTEAGSEDTTSGVHRRLQGDSYCELTNVLQSACS